MLSQHKKESPDGKVDRPILYMATDVYKNIPDDPLHPKHITQMKKRLGKYMKCDPNSSTQKHWDSDAVTSVFRRNGKGYVSGIGGDISKIEMLAFVACREQLRSGRQDKNAARPSTTAPQQVTGCILRNLRKKAVALGRVNFSTPPNDENY
ncbi:hypothetical protein MKX01_016287 [Papaver californicum]|nr:hypothetical protein MKX01_016287 [Papaver californicum]